MTPRQRKYLTNLSNRYGKAILETDLCCSLHASRAIRKLKIGGSAG